jgi:hypothetical protein
MKWASRCAMQANCEGSSRKGNRRSGVRVEFVGVIGTANHGPAGDMVETEGPGDVGVGVELIGGDELDDRQVTERRLEVLAEREDVAIDATQIFHGIDDLGFGFAEAEHETRLGVQRGGGPLRGLGQDTERPIISGAMTDRWGEATNGFEIVIKDMRLGIEHDLDGSGVVVEVRGEHLNDDAGIGVASRFDSARKMMGATIREIVPCNSRDNDMTQTQSTGGFGNSSGLLLIEREWFGGRHGAESAGAGAVITRDHERGGAFAPAFPMVGTTGAFANGVKAEFTQQVPGTGEGIGGWEADPQPIR